jgi:arginine decarboxylase
MPQSAPHRIDQFFNGPGGRADDWRDLVEAAKAWAAGRGDRGKYEALLNDLAVTEEYFGYPGLQLMSALKEAAASGDAGTSLALATRITNALMTRSFRQHAGDQGAGENGDGSVPELVPSTVARTEARRPYFETLIVTGVPATSWQSLANEWRKLRRPLDAFVYEPVIVGSLEDAFCAAMLNPNLAAVVVNEGFALRSRHDAPVLRSILAAANLKEEPDASALQLANIIKRIRPELDIYVMSNRDVEAMAGNPEANSVRRIFYSIEELLELHLSILEGIQDRYDTPFFDNLKKYAQRPIGTFHALPIARGKSVFRSDWIRDMGEFYGPNLFLAESSATTGGLDSLLEPTGNIKKAQDKAARAPTACSSSPTAPRHRTRWRCRRCWRRATSRSSTATATSRTTTAWCCRARSRSMSRRSR